MHVMSIFLLFVKYICSLKSQSIFYTVQKCSFRLQDNIVFSMPVVINVIACGYMMSVSSIIVYVSVSLYDGINTCQR